MTVALASASVASPIGALPPISRYGRILGLPGIWCSGLRRATSSAPAGRSPPKAGAAMAARHSWQPRRWDASWFHAAFERTIRDDRRRARLQPGPWRSALEPHVGRVVSGVALPGGDVNWSLGADESWLFGRPIAEGVLTSNRGARSPNDAPWEVFCCVSSAAAPSRWWLPADASNPGPDARWGVLIPATLSARLDAFTSGHWGASLAQQCQIGQARGTTIARARSTCRCPRVRLYPEPIGKSGLPVESELVRRKGGEVMKSS